MVKKEVATTELPDPLEPLSEGAPERKLVRVEMVKIENLKSIIIPKATITVKVRCKPGHPLMVHAWSKKAINMMMKAMVAKDSELAQDQEQEPYDAEQYALDAGYWLEERPKDWKEMLKYWNHPKKFPMALKAKAFTDAMGSAAWTYRKLFTGVKGAKDVYRTVTLRFDNPAKEYIRMTPLAEPIMHEEAARVGRGTQPRHRMLFMDWEATLTLEFDHRLYAPKTVLDWLELAGEAIGINEKRKEKGGSYGLWTTEVIGCEVPKLIYKDNGNGEKAKK